MLTHLKKLGNDWAPIIDEVRVPDDAETFEGIRCPCCHWHPSPASRWSCDCRGTPEPFFHGCLTVWNTFLTRGRCPGCAHCWQWTSCLSCNQSSLHIDWYEAPDPAS